MGAGVFSFYVENILISDSQFSNNTLPAYRTNRERDTNGGALYIENSVKFKAFNTKFYNNFAFSNGGAMYLKNLLETDIKESEFNKNKVYYDINVSKYQKDDKYIITQGGAICYDT